MGRSYVEIITDDLTGETLEEDQAHHVRFGWNNKWYELDLSEKNAEKFLHQMNKYVEVATPDEKQEAPRRRGRPSTKASAESGSRKEELAAIREWWRAQGNEIGDRGRIPQNVMEAYRAAHP